MFQKLPIAFAHVKTGNTSIWKLTKWNPSNDIFFILKEKNYQKVYSNIMNSIKL